MKLLFKMILVLGITAFASGFFLSFVYTKTLQEIEHNRKREIEVSIKELVPEGKRYKFSQLGGYKVYRVYNDKDEIVGYCILASGSGYQGEIKILIAVAADLEKLLGIKIVENVETPGLGGKITSDWFVEQFKNLKFMPKIEYVKNKKPVKKNQIQAITGATISSSSVVRIINTAIKKVLPALENEK